MEAFCYIIQLNDALQLYSRTQNTKNVILKLIHLVVRTKLFKTNNVPEVHATIFSFEIVESVSENFEHNEKRCRNFCTFRTHYLKQHTITALTSINTNRNMKFTYFNKKNNIKVE